MTRSAERNSKRPFRASLDPLRDVPNILSRSRKNGVNRQGGRLQDWKVLVEEFLPRNFRERVGRLRSEGERPRLRPSAVSFRNPGTCSITASKRKRACSMVQRDRMRQILWLRRDLSMLQLLEAALSQRNFTQIGAWR